MIYKLTSIDIKQGKSGKSFATTYWKDQDGHDNKALMFKDFEGLKVGDDIEGSILPWKDAAVFNVTKHDTTNTYRKPWGGGGKAEDIKQAQGRREASIAISQDRKEAGIGVSIALGKAVDIALASLKDQPFPTDQDVKQEVNKWFEFLQGKFDAELDKAKHS